MIPFAEALGDDRCFDHRGDHAHPPVVGWGAGPGPLPLVDSSPGFPTCSTRMRVDTLGHLPTLANDPRPGGGCSGMPASALARRSGSFQREMILCVGR